MRIQLYVSKCDFLCCGQQKLRCVWIHYKSTGGLYCRTVTMEMIDSRRHFKALRQPHKLRLDLNTTVPPRTETQIPIRENRFDFTNGLFGGAFMGLMFSMMSQFLSVNTHTALLLPLLLTHTCTQTYTVTHTHPEACFSTNETI